jgi:hypothetical protein
VILLAPEYANTQIWMKPTMLQLLEGYRVQWVHQGRQWQGILKNNNQPKPHRLNRGGKGEEVQPGGVHGKCTTLWHFEGIMVTKMALRIWYSQHAVLKVWYSQCYANSSGYEKNKNPQSSVLPIYNFGQQSLNGAANWSATKGGQVTQHSFTLYLSILYLSFVLHRSTSWSPNQNIT